MRNYVIGTSDHAGRHLNMVQAENVQQALEMCGVLDLGKIPRRDMETHADVDYIYIEEPTGALVESNKCENGHAIPDTCTPGTMTCGDCIRGEYCEKGFVAKKKAYQDRQRLAARPTIVKLDNPECDPAGGYFHYFKLDEDGKTYLNDNELEPWMPDAALSEQEFDARGNK